MVTLLLIGIKATDGPKVARTLSSAFKILLDRRKISKDLKNLGYCPLPKSRPPLLIVKSPVVRRQDNAIHDQSVSSG